MPMRNKVKWNDTGSAILFSMLLLFLLSILGITLISVTISNLKTNKITGEMGTAFYMADGAIEEALAEIKEMTHVAEAEATQWINDESQYKATDTWKDFISDINEGLNNPVEEPELSQDEATERIENHLKAEFERKYFDQLVAGSTLKSEHLEILETVSFTPTFDDEKLKNIKGLDVISSYSPVDKKIVLSITSDASYNKYHKKLHINIDILLPEYDYVISNTIEKKRIYLNGIYGQALTSEGNILVMGDAVEISGDVYAYGTFPEEVWPSSENMGGIIAGYKGMDGMSISDSGGSNRLKITGDVMTRGNIQAAKNNASITIDGKAYCDSLLVNSSSEGGSITVNGQVVMYDDAEINGINGKITVGGNLWGVFEGDPAGKYNDRSSSIIVNADGGNENIAIGGGAFLGGTAYIGAYKTGSDPRKYYQTGESVSLSKYSSIYQTVLPEESYVILAPYTDGINDYNFVTDSESERSGIANAQFKIQHFLRYAFFYKDDIDKQILAEDKAKIQIAAIDKELDNVEDSYAFGAVVANGKIYNPNPEIPGEESYFINAYQYSIGREVILKEIDAKANILKDRDYTNSRNKPSRFDEFYNQDITIHNNTTDYNNFLLVNLDSNKDVYINPTTEISDGSFVFNSSEIKGIILTKGNIYISGELNYVGTMISQKNIVFYGSGEKTIQHHEEKIINMLASNRDLYHFFYGDTGKKVEIDGNSASNTLDVTVENNNIYNPGDEKPYKEVSISNASSLGSNKKKTIKTFTIQSWKEVH